MDDDEEEGRGGGGGPGPGRWNWNPSVLLFCGGGGSATSFLAVSLLPDGPACSRPSGSSSQRRFRVAPSAIVGAVSAPS